MICTIVADDACLSVSGSIEFFDAVPIGLHCAVIFPRTEPGNAEAFLVCNTPALDPVKFSFARIDTADTAGTATTSVSFVLFLFRLMFLFFLLIEILHRHDDLYFRLVQILCSHNASKNFL